MTETDRELLKLAAKALRLTYRDDLWNAGHIKTQNGTWKEWNPLTDDGDALRLAVKLGFTVEMHGCNATHPYACAFDCMRNIAEEEQPDDGDPYAATRRAIVRAAAKIGECLP